MKRLAYILFATSIIGYSIYSCKKETTSKKELIFSGKLVSKSDCKNSVQSAQAGTLAASDSLSRIDYLFDESTNVLTIGHSNVRLNCCSDSVYSVISLNNDTIVIKEAEKNPKCFCYCYSDLKMEIQGVESKKYFIKIAEPYSTQNNSRVLTVDLATNKKGSLSAATHSVWED